MGRYICDDIFGAQEFSIELNVEFNATEAIKAVADIAIPKDLTVHLKNGSLIATTCEVDTLDSMVMLNGVHRVLLKRGTSTVGPRWIDITNPIWWDYALLQQNNVEYIDSSGWLLPKWQGGIDFVPSGWQTNVTFSKLKITYTDGPVFMLNVSTDQADLYSNDFASTNELVPNGIDIPITWIYGYDEDTDEPIYSRIDGINADISVIDLYTDPMCNEDVRISKIEIYTDNNITVPIRDDYQYITEPKLGSNILLEYNRWVSGAYINNSLVLISGNMSFNTPEEPYSYEFTSSSAVSIDNGITWEYYSLPYNSDSSNILIKDNKLWRYGYAYYHANQTNNLYLLSTTNGIDWVANLVLNQVDHPEYGAVYSWWVATAVLGNTLVVCVNIDALWPNSRVLVARSTDGINWSYSTIEVSGKAIGVYRQDIHNNCLYLYTNRRDFKITITETGYTGLEPTGCNQIYPLYSKVNNLYYRLIDDDGAVSSIAISTDAVDYITHTLPATMISEWQFITYNNGVYYVCGFKGVSLATVDFIEYIKISSPKGCVNSFTDTTNTYIVNVHSNILTVL